MAKPIKTGDTVRVAGLDQFRRQLRRIEQEGGPDGIALLKEANHRVASMVIGKAQARAATVGRQQAKAASTLKAGRQQARATISGGTGIRFFFGAEFGSYSNILRDRGGRRFLGFNQFLNWKQPGNGNTGYFLFPTMKAESKNIIEMYGDELDRIAKDAFPD